MSETVERAPDINKLTGSKSILDIVIEAGGFWLYPLKARKLRGARWSLKGLSHQMGSTLIDIKG